MFCIFSELVIKRTAENGGDITVVNYSDLENIFASERLHPGDLKSAVIEVVNDFFNKFRAIPDLQKVLSAAFPVVKGGKKQQTKK